MLALSRAYWQVAGLVVSLTLYSIAAVGFFFRVKESPDSALLVFDLPMRAESAYLLCILGLSLSAGLLVLRVGHWPKFEAPMPSHDSNRMLEIQS